MPHFGQLPGPILRTSGSIGQMYSVCSSSCDGDSGCRRWTYLPGSAENLLAHPWLQKKYRVPSCSPMAAAVVGSTCMPQTGSTTFVTISVLRSL